MNTLSKAVVVGRLNQIIADLRGPSNAIVWGKDMKQLKEGGEALGKQVHRTLEELNNLCDQIRESKDAELELLPYSKRLVETSLQMTSEKIRKRYANFPIAAALAETILMLVEADLLFAASFMQLRDKAGCEDRASDHHKFYKVDGEPKNG